MKQNYTFTKLKCLKMITFLYTNTDISDFIWEREDILSGKLYKEGDCCNDDKVKYGQFVHLLANTGLPTLWTKAEIKDMLTIFHHNIGHRLIEKRFLRSMLGSVSPCVTV